MDYQLQISFSDGRSTVEMQAKDERGAYDMFSAMSRMPGVASVFMGGTKRERTEAEAADARQRQEEEQEEEERRQRQTGPEDEAQQPYDGPIPDDPSPAAEEEQQAPLEMRPQQVQGYDTPFWAKTMLGIAAEAARTDTQAQVQEPAPLAMVPVARQQPQNVPVALQRAQNVPVAFQQQQQQHPQAAAAGRHQLPSRQGTTQRQQQQQQQEPVLHPRSNGATRAPPLQPIAARAPAQSSGSDPRSGGGKVTPLEEYGGEVQLGHSESKRFKRAVDPVPTGGGAAGGRRANPYRAIDGPGQQQGFTRPFNKGDADMLLGAADALEACLSADAPNDPERTPTLTASAIMQRLVPKFANVDWTNHAAYHEDFKSIFMTCQCILTGQALPQSGKQVK